MLHFRWWIDGSFDIMVFSGGDRVVQLKTNKCGRFQSSFSSVVITESPSIFFTGMEDSVLGVWSAHGEGSLEISSQSLN